MLAILDFELILAVRRPWSITRITRDWNLFCTKFTYKFTNMRYSWYTMSMTMSNTPLFFFYGCNNSKLRSGILNISKRSIGVPPYQKKCKWSRTAEPAQRHKGIQKNVGQGWKIKIFWSLGCNFLWWFYGGDYIGIFWGSSIALDRSDGRATFTRLPEARTLPLLSFLPTAESLSCPKSIGSRGGPPIFQGQKYSSCSKAGGCWTAELLGAFRGNLLIVSWVTPTPGCTANFPGNPCSQPLIFASFRRSGQELPVECQVKPFPTNFSLSTAEKGHEKGCTKGLGSGNQHCGNQHNDSTSKKITRKSHSKKPDFYLWLTKL
jgi:hypothetical protein